MITLKLVVDSTEFIHYVKQVQAQAKHTFFTSDSWLNAWLSVNHSAQRIAFFDGDCVVGTCTVNEAKQKKLGVTWSTLYLNRSGKELLDQVWIEYNDLLICSGYETAVWQSFIHYFEQTQTEELVIGMSKKLAAIECFEQFKFEYKILTPNYELKLKPEYVDAEQVLAGFSRNTRSQLKRAIKTAKALDELKVIKADSTQQALNFFYQAGEYHKQRWPDSGFKNKTFIDFHLNLITAGFERNQIDVVKICCGDSILAIYYYFLYQGRVYFYLGAVNYLTDNKKLKPGLLAHFLMIQWYAKSGYQVYDWLAGEAQYKKSLAGKVSYQYMYSFTKNNFKQRQIARLRKLKAFFQKTITRFK